MTEKQSVTVSLPKDLLNQAENVAMVRNTTLSELLTQLLTETIDSEDRYQSAQSHHLSMLSRGLFLGTEGKQVISRAELHVRQDHA